MGMGGSAGNADAPPAKAAAAKTSDPNPYDAHHH